MKLKKYISHRDIEVFNPNTNTLETKSVEIWRFESEQERKLKIKNIILWVLAIACFIAMLPLEAIICIFIQDKLTCCLVAFGALIVAVCIIYLLSHGIDKTQDHLDQLNDELWQLVINNANWFTARAKRQAEKWRALHPVEEAIRKAIENKDSVSVTQMLKEIKDINKKENK